MYVYLLVIIHTCMLQVCCWHKEYVWVRTNNDEYHVVDGKHEEGGKRGGGGGGRTGSEADSPMIGVATEQ